MNKSDCYENKKLFKIDEIDIDNILLSKKEPYGIKNSFKYFIGYNDKDVIRPLRINLPKIIGYAKYFNSNKTISFKANDEELLRK